MQADFAGWQTRSSTFPTVLAKCSILLKILRVQYSSVRACTGSTMKKMFIFFTENTCKKRA